MTDTASGIPQPEMNRRSQADPQVRRFEVMMKMTVMKSPVSGEWRAKLDVGDKTGRFVSNAHETPLGAIRGLLSILRVEEEDFFFAAEYAAMQGLQLADEDKKLLLTEGEEFKR